MNFANFQHLNFFFSAIVVINLCGGNVNEEKLIVCPSKSWNPNEVRMVHRIIHCSRKLFHNPGVKLWKFFGCIYSNYPCGLYVKLGNIDIYHHQIIFRLFWENQLSHRFSHFHFSELLNLKLVKSVEEVYNKNSQPERKLHVEAEGKETETGTNKRCGKWRNFHSP